MVPLFHLQLLPAALVVSSARAARPTTAAGAEAAAPTAESLSPISPGANTSNLPLDLLLFALFLCHSVDLLLAQDIADVSQRGPPQVNSGGVLLPLLLAEDALGNLVNQEHLSMLRKLPLAQACSDDVDCPHLDFFDGDLQGLCYALVLDLATGSRSGETGKRQETHFPLQLMGIQLLLFHKVDVIVVEVDIVVEVLLGEDVQKLGIYRMRVAKSSDAGDRTEILKEVVGR